MITYRLKERLGKVGRMEEYACTFFVMHLECVCVCVFLTLFSSPLKRATAPCLWEASSLILMRREDVITLYQKNVVQETDMSTIQFVCIANHIHLHVVERMTDSRGHLHLYILLLLEFDAVPACIWVLLHLKIIAREAKVAQKHVSEILQLAQHFFLLFLLLLLQGRGCARAHPWRGPRAHSPA